MNHITKQNIADHSVAARDWRAVSGLAFLLLVVGCAHAPLNRPLVCNDPEAGYRFHGHSQTNQPEDDILIFLFFSGGGTRAAALSYGVLEELAHTPMETQGKQTRLLDQVDFISAVSGGSFTAAYYCLYGDRIFKDFEGRFLKRDTQDELIWQLILPGNWPRLLSPNFSRTDLAAEFYNRHLFVGATFADLETRRAAPFLVINATDMGTGGGFSFTQYSFDLIGSDLANYPVAQAVAASSALSPYFSPITLRNYAGGAGHAKSDWLERLEQTNTLTSRQQNLARRLETYADSKRRPFIHLIDGGLADNLGLSSFMDANTVFGGVANTLEHFHIERAHKIVMIMVDASVHRIMHFDQSENPPGLLTVQYTMVDNLVNRTSSETEEEFKANMDEWRQTMIKRNGSRQSKAATPVTDLKYYFINVNFGILSDPAERDFFENLPTNFKLPAKTVDRLRDVGGRLLLESSEYQRLLHDLKASAR